MAEQDPERLLEELAKILGDPTRRSIYFRVRSAPDPLRATEIAGEFYLHRNVARSHLDKLAKAGLLKTELRQGRSGRPAKTYSPTERALEVTIPARNFRALADLAIDVLAAGEAVDGMTRRATQLGQEWQANDAVGPEESRPVPAATECVARRLSAYGCEATSYDLADSVELEIRNCVFRESAQRHPEVVCQAHQAAVHGMFEAAGVKVELEVEETLAEGGNACRFSVLAAAPSDS